MSQLKYAVFNTNLGWIAALVSARGLRRATLKDTPQAALDELGPEGLDAEEDPAALEEIRARYEAYLGGASGALDDMPLDMDGATEFTKAAWEACRSIPPGETRSYQWLAVQAGKPRAPRAAGQTMAKNRLILVIPCHRVIGSDGSLHGYGSGLDRKARLLEMERDAIARNSG